LLSPEGRLGITTPDKGHGIDLEAVRTRYLQERICIVKLEYPSEQSLMKLELKSLAGVSPEN